MKFKFNKKIIGFISLFIILTVSAVSAFPTFRWVRPADFLDEPVKVKRALKPNEVANIKENLDYLLNNKADKPIVCTGSNKALTWDGNNWGCNTLISSSNLGSSSLNLPQKMVRIKFRSNQEYPNYIVYAKVINGIRLIKIYRRYCTDSQVMTGTCGGGDYGTGYHYTSCTGWMKDAATCDDPGPYGIIGGHTLYYARFANDKVVRCQYSYKYNHDMRTCITW